MSMRTLIALTSYLGTTFWIRTDQVAQVEPAPFCESNRAKTVITRACDGEEIYVQESPEEVIQGMQLPELPRR